jgi:hypothetical protein
VGFSRVEVRLNIFVSIFSEFCILLIFYFCIENDVHNPHVSVIASQMAKHATMYSASAVLREMPGLLPTLPRDHG